MTRGALRKAAHQILRAGLVAVEPGRLIRQHLRISRAGISVAGLKVAIPMRLFVVAVGKAAIPMARTACRILGARMTAGIVIAPERAPRLPRMTSFVSSHPVPDATGVKAGGVVIKLLQGAKKDDLVLLLLSGGASALMPAPIDGVSLAHKQRVTRLLLKRGANIAETNAVRKRLSRLKGGGFARLAAPARVVALALSDVPGDDVRVIGSGPAVDDPAAGVLARKTVRRFLRANELSPTIRCALEKNPVKTSTITRAETKVIGSGRTFAEAAGRKARELGFACEVIPDALRGEARECGPALVSRFQRRGKTRLNCLILTGETVVRVTGRGRGGRNQELALSAIPALGQLPQATVLAAFSTDGRDGPTSASGGMVDDQTAARAEAAGVSVAEALKQNNSYEALRQLESLIVTGPTSTNVADVVLIVG